MERPSYRLDDHTVTEALHEAQQMSAQQAPSGLSSLSGASNGDGDRLFQTTSSYPVSTTKPIPSNVVSDVDQRHFGIGSEEPSSGFFHNAQNPVFYKATLIDNSTTINASQSLAMDKLRSHIDSNAAVDSSAREPPPTCHPKTRLEIRKKLTALFHDVNKKWWMLWLFGAAGTGKSAVGQTFATECDERGELGAAFFFSRPNGRDKYKTVIPTLAYQLATHCPPYRPALIAKIDHDHEIFYKKPPVQLKKLIIEPLLEVRPRITTTFLMLLDGVDECGANAKDAYEREKEQRELVKMIAETVRDYPNLPLFWFLCSRPEQHLQKAFGNITTLCGREELVIDVKCREEVEVVLREGFANIVEERDIVATGPGGWPSKDEFDIVERAVAGLHVFGAAILKDIEHSASPVRQLKSLIPFLEHVTGVCAPGSIQVMDMFYARILGEVPKDDLPTTLRIIGTLLTLPTANILPTQVLCNFMRLDPNDFLSALRMVHSVINIPPPNKVGTVALRIYHTSFSDFLTNVSRSRNFFIDKQKVLVDIIKSCFFWHISHFHHFHRTPSRPFAQYDPKAHNHGPLPQTNFTWSLSTDQQKPISHLICLYAAQHCFALFGKVSDQYNEELLFFVHTLDFRYISKAPLNDIIGFLHWVHKWDSSSGLIRTTPETDQDRLLLANLEILMKEPVTPARLPVRWDVRYRLTRSCQYLFFGRDSLTVIIFCIGVKGEHSVFALNLEQDPKKSPIDYCGEHLRKVGWWWQN